MTTKLYYWNNKEKLQAYQKHYRATEKYREKQRTYFAEWYKKNGRDYHNARYLEAHLRWKQDHPDGIKAHYLLNYALEKGRLSKPASCQKCSKEKPLQAHHDDYSKPYDVLWLCGSCHRLHHINA